MIRAALYLRVSTTDKGQETDNQLLQLQEFCDRHNWQIAQTYIDRESGTKGKRERDGFSQLFIDAGKRKFDVVLFWSLDRFSREGIRKTIAYLQQLSNLGCRFKSYTEPLLDTENELVAHIVVGVLSYLAQQEAVRISERTKAGLQRVRARGQKLGRPDGFEQWKDLINALLADGLTLTQIKHQTGLSWNTVKSYIARLDRAM